MHEALHPIRQATPASPPVSRSRRGGRGKGTPFALNDEPPTESDTEEPAAPTTPDRAHAHLDAGHRLDDEEGQTIDVTA